MKSFILIIVLAKNGGKKKNNLSFVLLLFWGKFDHVYYSGMNYLLVSLHFTLIQSMH